MGSQIGVEKVAAGRIGVSYLEWLQRRAAGQKWCTYGRHWDWMILFPPDSTRGDGRAQGCWSCLQTYQKARERKRPPRQNDPIRDAAMRAVGHAIERGEVPNPNKLPCAACGHMGADKRHEYHHYKGYGPENRLSVEPLCSRCHKIETRRSNGLSTWEPPLEG